VNRELSRLAAELPFNDTGCESFRLAFGLACVDRVRHLLEDARAIECLAVLRAFLDGSSDRAALAQAQKLIAEVANSHRGSNSIDGTAHAAVSATYAAANALAGRALEAADYAAYASVYAYGGYAVTDPSAFEAEFAWQCGKFKELLALQAAGALHV
jgi:hypothetical protein